MAFPACAPNGLLMLDEGGKRTFASFQGDFGVGDRLALARQFGNTPAQILDQQPRGRNPRYCFHKF
jgi:hypothetical protein